MTRSRQTADWGSRAGLAKIVPSSVAVGSGTGSADSLGNVTFTTVSSVSLNGCFSSTYDNYLIAVYLTSVSATTDLNLRVRASGTDATGSVYSPHINGVRSTGAAFLVGAATQSSCRVGSQNVNAPFPAFSFTMFNPFNTRETTYAGSGFFRDSTSTFGANIAGLVDNQTSYDGLTIIPSSGTINGSIRVYGITQ